MEEVVLALGSNLGDREGYLLHAIELITAEVGEVIRRSSVYETPSWGFNSFSFLNQIVVIKTTYSPFLLLEKLQCIERLLGRDKKSSIKDGKSIYRDRTIDIDILFYGNLRMDDERLVIPHPKINEREFILQPLRELNIDIPEN